MRATLQNSTDKKFIWFECEINKGMPAYFPKLLANIEKIGRALFLFPVRL